jgi:tetratricopeptide (TPR) repeat protein
VNLAKLQCGEIGPSVASAENELANALFYQKKFKEADELYKRAFIVAQRFKKDTDHTLQASWNLANCRFAEQQYADALELYKNLQRAEKEIQACQTELDKLPQSQRKAKDIPAASGDPEICKQLINAAIICMKSDRSWDAKSVLEAAETELSGNKQPALQAQVLLAKAELAMNGGDYKKAAESCQSAIEKAGRDPKLKAVRAAAQAQLLLSQFGTQNYDAAAETYKALQANADQQTWEQLIDPLNQLFSKRRLYNCPENAISLLKTVCEQCIKTAPEKSLMKARAQYNLAHTYQLDRAKTDLAGAAYLQALATAASAPVSEGHTRGVPVFADRDSLIFQIESDLGMAYMFNQQFKESEEQLSKALAYAEKNPGQENRRLRNAISSMSALYNNAKQPEKEEAYYLRGMALDDSPPSFRKSKRISDLSNLCRMSTARGDYKSTEARLEEAISLGADSGQLQSISQDLLRLYQRFGLYDKIAALYLKQAQALNGTERLRNLYLASEAEFKGGKFQDAEKQIREVIDALEQSNQAKDKDFGCYYQEPRYSRCLFLLGNCLLDGENNYDKAIVVFDKFSKHYEQPGGGPECRPVANPSLAPQARVPEVEELVNMLICCNGIGNKERASTFRDQLKARLTQNRQAPQSNDNQQAIISKAVELIDKSKLSRVEEISLMELVPKALHTPGQYSGRSDGAELLERAIVLRKKNNSLAEIKDDYRALCSIYIDNRNFDLGEPAAYLNLDYLKQHGGSKQDLSIAELNYAGCLTERGYFNEGKKMLLGLLANSSSLETAKQFELYGKLSLCSKYLKEFPEAIKYSEQALKFAGEGTQNQATVLAELNSLKQNVKKP